MAKRNHNALQTNDKQYKEYHSLKDTLPLPLRRVTGNLIKPGTLLPLPVTAFCKGILQAFYEPKTSLKEPPNTWQQGRVQTLLQVSQ